MTHFSFQTDSYLPLLNLHHQI